MRKKSTRRGNSAKLFIVLAATLLSPLVFMAVRTIAAGTAAGTVISNQVYIDYEDVMGNPMARVYTNTVTTTVSQVAGVLLDPDTGAKAGSNGNTVMYLFQVFNTGNGNDSFDLTYSVTAGWTPTSVTFYYDTNNNHTYDAGTDTVMTASGGKYTTGTVTADDDYDVFMFVTIPAVGTAPNNSTSQITITATSKYDGTVTDTGVYTTTVAAAVVNAVKSAVPSSPEPGDTVTYTITLTNSGSSSAASTVVTDPIPANLTYVPGTITLQGVTKTDANDGDGSDYNFTTAGAVTVTVGTIAAGVTRSITFQATVNAAIPAGTAISNIATVNYTSGGNPISTTSNGGTFLVGTSASVDITATIVAQSGDPGAPITYAFTVTNNGNNNDVIDLTYTSGSGLTWVLWADANGDGIAGNDGDYILTDTDGDGKVDTGSLPQGTGISVLAVATIPAGTPDQTKTTLTVTATSSNDTSSQDSQAFSTTVAAPVLRGTKEVSPTGSQPPGTTLTYTITITNIGTGTAKSVVATDKISNDLSYNTGSIETGATVGTLVSRTDADDGDGALFDSVTNTLVLGAAGNVNLGAGGTIVLRFTADIK